MRAEDNVYQFVLIAVPMNYLILCLGHPKSTAWFSEQFCKKKKDMEGKWGLFLFLNKSETQYFFFKTSKF